MDPGPISLSLPSDLHAVARRLALEGGGRTWREVACWPGGHWPGDELRREKCDSHEALNSEPIFPSFLLH
eukprot:scaffold292_cov161-Ochromonas_danica.AAC.7